MSPKSIATAFLLVGLLAARASATYAAPDSVAVAAREARARALVEDARARFAEGSFAQRRTAIRLFEEAAQLEPKDPATLNALGHGYLDAGYNHLTRVTFEKLTRIAPDSPDGWYRSASPYQPSGESGAMRVSFSNVTRVRWL